MSLIAAVEGTLDAKMADGVLVRVGGVTLSIAVPAHDLAALPRTGETVRLMTHLVVREDDLQLYGFSDGRGRALFESLLGVNGVGPKAALAVLSVMPAEELASTIIAGDAAALSRAQGVGRRTAERIILELRGKLEDELGTAYTISTAGPAGTSGDPALNWLVGLGFSGLEARQALAVEREEGLDTDERVRRALQRMGRSDG